MLSLSGVSSTFMVDGPALLIVDVVRVSGLEGCNQQSPGSEKRGKHTVALGQSTEKEPFAQEI